MDDSIPRNRRRFLEGVGVGSGLLLAGCTEQLGLGGDSGTDQVDSGDGETADGVAAIAAVDQEAIREEQVELQEELQRGNISQEEAQEELATLREEYLEEAMNALTTTVEETEGAAVDEEYRSLGAVIVTGEAGAILGMLDSEDVSAFVSRADVESQIQAQQTQTTQE